MKIMSNIVSISGDFKLTLSKIVEPFREFYDRITSLRPALQLHEELSNQIADDSLKLIHLNLIVGELQGKINPPPPARSLKTNDTWYFNRFISISSSLEQTFPTDCELFTFHKGGGVEWVHVLKEISGFDDTTRKKFYNDLPPHTIEPYYVKLLKENPHPDLSFEVKENIENKLYPFLEEFKIRESFQ